MSHRENEIPAALIQSLGDRLKLSLRHAGITEKQMAEYLELHRNSVGNWVTGRATPLPIIIRVWAEKTGVPVEWLRTGSWPGGAAPVVPDLIGATEAAALLGCNVVTIHRYVKLGHLTPVGRLGTSKNSAVIFSKLDVLDLAQRRDNRRLA